MKLVDLTCTHCGAKLKVDIDSKEATCEFCGAKLMIDDEVKHTQIDNAEEAGYQFEKGRQRAKEELKYTSTTPSTPSPKKEKKKNLVWWVLGWIFIFPLPLTIILIRTKKVAKWLKIVFIVIAWLVYGVIVASAASGDKDKNKQQIEAVEETTKTIDTDDKNYQVKRIEDFVEEFNKKSATQLVFNEDFVPSEEGNGHYRHEFRLNAYKDATGKSYLYGDITVDLVVANTIFKNDPDLRIYVPYENLDQVLDIIKVSLPILDKTITSEQVQETINKIVKNGSANGLYLGENNKIGINVLYNELMIKYE